MPRALSSLPPFRRPRHPGSARRGYTLGPNLRLHLAAAAEIPAFMGFVDWCGISDRDAAKLLGTTRLPDADADLTLEQLQRIHYLFDVERSLRAWADQDHAATWLSTPDGGELQERSACPEGGWPDWSIGVGSRSMIMTADERIGMPDDGGERLVLPRYGQTREDAIDTILQLEESPPPDLTKLKPQELLVAVRSASVSFIDLLMMSGQYQTMLPLPCVPGMEYAGIVLGTGAGIDPRKVAVGDRVLSDFLVTGPRSLGDYAAQGGWQSYALAPENGVHRIPKCLTFDQGCNLLLNYETSYYAFVNRAKLQPGETVLITGASGAAGMAAVQVAKILGPTVIATGRSDEKLAQVKAFGAGHVINTWPRGTEAGVPKIRDDVKALTGGRGVEVVFDTVGGDVSQEALRSLTFGGRMVIIGWAENTRVAQGGGKRGSDNADRLPTNIMQMKGLYVMGSPMVIHSGREPAIRIPRLESIFKWVSEGQITPSVADTYPLADYKRAMHAKRLGKATGNSVLHPKEFPG